MLSRVGAFVEKFFFFFKQHSSRTLDMSLEAPKGSSAVSSGVSEDIFHTLENKCSRNMLSSEPSERFCQTAASRVTSKTNLRSVSVSTREIPPLKSKGCH